MGDDQSIQNAASWIEKWVPHVWDSIGSIFFDYRATSETDRFYASLFNGSMGELGHFKIPPYLDDHKKAISFPDEILNFPDKYQTITDKGKFRSYLGYINEAIRYTSLYRKEKAKNEPESEHINPLKHCEFFLLYRLKAIIHENPDPNQVLDLLKGVKRILEKMGEYQRPSFFSGTPDGRWHALHKAAESIAHAINTYQYAVNNQDIISQCSAIAQNLQSAMRALFTLLMIVTNKNKNKNGVNYLSDHSVNWLLGDVPTRYNLVMPHEEKHKGVIYCLIYKEKGKEKGYALEQYANHPESTQNEPIKIIKKNAEVITQYLEEKPPNKPAILSLIREKHFHSMLIKPNYTSSTWKRRDSTYYQPFSQPCFNSMIRLLAHQASIECDEGVAFISNYAEFPGIRKENAICIEEAKEIKKVGLVQIKTFMGKDSAVLRLKDKSKEELERAVNGLNIYFQLAFSMQLLLAFSLQLKKLAQLAGATNLAHPETYSKLSQAFHLEKKNMEALFQQYKEASIIDLSLSDVRNFSLSENLGLFLENRETISSKLNTVSETSLSIASHSEFYKLEQEQLALEKRLDQLAVQIIQDHGESPKVAELTGHTEVSFLRLPSGEEPLTGYDDCDGPGSPQRLRRSTSLCPLNQDPPPEIRKSSSLYTIPERSNRGESEELDSHSKQPSSFSKSKSSQRISPWIRRKGANTNKKKRGILRSVSLDNVSDIFLKAKTPADQAWEMPTLELHGTMEEETTENQRLTEENQILTKEKGELAQKNAVLEQENVALNCQLKVKASSEFKHLQRQIGRAERFFQVAKKRLGGSDKGKAFSLLSSHLEQLKKTVETLREESELHRLQAQYQRLICLTALLSKIRRHRVFDAFYWGVLLPGFFGTLRLAAHKVLARLFDEKTIETRQSDPWHAPRRNLIGTRSWGLFQDHGLACDLPTNWKETIKNDEQLKEIKFFRGLLNGKILSDISTEDEAASSGLPDLSDDVNPSLISP